jgi:hypothetical protein
VVSKVHCTLNITASGYVYITDLGSAHGTRIAPRSESPTMALDPHRPARLLEGDTIILGKVIVADDVIHQALRLRVVFQHKRFGVAWGDPYLEIGKDLLESRECPAQFLIKQDGRGVAGDRSLQRR